MSGRRGAGGCGPPCAPSAALYTLRLHTPAGPAPALSGRAAHWPGVAGRDDGAVTGEEQLAAESRKGELSGRLVTVRERIAAACVAAGRDPRQVTLVAVTKTFPASDVRLLYELGVRDVGENRDQEAAPKAAECADLAPELTWHFVGQLQTNKAASVVRYARVVHSVDRLRLARVLGQQARKAGRVVTCLVQVSLDAHPDPGRAGAAPAQIPELAAAVAAEEGLLLGGVMAIAPLGVPPAQAFAPLPAAAAAVREIRPEAAMISAGMSGDMEAAIAVGATHVRVGTALLGDRPSFVG
jgi:pyridoxal phosphate enzyme (YggS family)